MTRYYSHREGQQQQDCTRVPMSLISILLLISQGYRWHKQCRWWAGQWRWAWSKWACSASQEQTLSGTGACVYTAHTSWLGVVTGISADSTEDVLVVTMSLSCTISQTMRHIGSQLPTVTYHTYMRAWSHLILPRSLASEFINQMKCTYNTK